MLSITRVASVEKMSRPDIALSMKPHSATRDICSNVCVDSPFG